MRNSLIIINLFFLFCFTSCSGNKKKEDSIVGTWEFYNIVVDEVKTNSKQNDEIIEQATIKDMAGGFENSSMTFNKDLTFRDINKNNPSLSSSGTYTFSNSDKKLNLTETKSGELIPLDAQIENKELILTIDYANLYNGMADFELKIINPNIDPKEFKAEKVKLKIYFRRV